MFVLSGLQKTPHDHESVCGSDVCVRDGGGDSAQTGDLTTFHNMSDPA